MTTFLMGLRFLFSFFMGRSLPVCSKCSLLASKNFSIDSSSISVTLTTPGDISCDFATPGDFFPAFATLATFTTPATPGDFSFGREKKNRPAPKIKIP